MTEHSPPGINELKEGEYLDLRNKPVFTIKQMIRYAHLYATEKMPVDKYIEQTYETNMLWKISRIVCSIVGVPVHLVLTSKRRFSELILAAQIIMTLMRVCTSQGTISIGAMVGGRDHATVCHATKTVKNIFTHNAGTDEAFIARRAIEQVREELNMKEDLIEKMLNL